MNHTYRIKRDQRGVTLERQNEHGQWALVYYLPWELPRIAAELMAQPNLDEGHRELLRIYAMGKPTAEYFQVGAEHHNHGDPVCHSQIGYVLPDYENPGAYYLFPQPRAFDGQPYPEPRWHGDYWCQTVRLPVPPVGRIVDVQPCRDEPWKISVRWSRRSTLRVYSGTDTLLGALRFGATCFVAPDAPKPFTWEDACRAMLAGGECEAKHPHQTDDGFRRCRIRDGERQSQLPNGLWVSWGHNQEDWREMQWRPCSAPARYTWEQAEAGMRHTEIWVAKHKRWKIPMQFAVLPEDNHFFCRVNKHDDWARYGGSVPLTECEWRPLEECEQRCTCGARVFPQHKHGCPAGGESWSK